MLLLENYIPAVRYGGLNTAMDANFSGTVNFTGGVTRTITPTGENDHVTIQSYLNAVGLAGGGQILMRAGTYDIAGQINWLYDNIELLGEGPATNWVVADSLGSDVLRIGDGGTTAVDNFQVSNFQITGNDDNQSVATYGIHLYQLCTNGTVENMYIHDLYGKGVYNDGKLGTRNKYIKIVNNYIANTNSAGDYDCIDNQNADNCLVEGNICIFPGDDAIDFGTGDYVVITGNTVIGASSSQTGVGTGIETDACNHLVISNNAIYHANDYAIRIENQNNTVCVGNNIYSSWHKGIELQGADYCIVSGNSIRRTGQTTNNTYSAIDLNSDGSNHCTNNRITDNLIREDGSNKAQYGIKETDSNQNSNIITDNDIYGAVTAAVLRNGANSVFKRNTGSNPDGTHAQGNVTGATTFNRVNGETITATLTGNITVTLTNGVQPGDVLRLVLTQDGTGNRTATWPSNFKKAGGTLTLSTGAAAVDTITAVWDGSNWLETGRALNLS